MPEDSCEHVRTYSTIEEAFDAARDDAGPPDTIKLGAATYELRHPLFGNGVGSLVGHGADRTTVTYGGDLSHTTLLTLDDPASSVTGITLDLGGLAYATGLELGGTGSDIKVTGAGAGNPQTGVLLRPGAVLDGVAIALSGDGTGAYVAGGTLRHATIAVAFPQGGAGGGTAAEVPAGVLEDSTLTGARGVTGIGTVRRVSITAQGDAVSGSGTLEDADVRVIGPHRGIAISGGSLTARHVTLAGDGSPGSVGGSATVTNAADPRASSASLTIRDSIIRGFDTDLVRTTTGCTTDCRGRSDLDVDYTDYEFSKVQSSGNGTFSPAAGHAHNLDVEPGFVDAANDHHLLARSPLVDAGEPGLQGEESPVDLSSLPRVADGNGDGATATDMGAFEYQRRPPLITAGVKPASAAAGSLFTFTANAADPDPGDVVTFAWSEKGHRIGTGRTLRHRFATAGKHVVTALGTDSAGASASATATVTVIPRPVITFARLTNRRFAVGRAPRRGTTLVYSVNERATMRIVIDRVLRGRRAAVGAFERKGKPGTNSIKFSGRIGTRALAPGRYLLKLVATAGGAHSKRVSLPFSIVHR